MNTMSMLYRFDHPPIERVVLPPVPSLTDGLQVVEHAIEEITLPIQGRNADVFPIIH